MNNYEATKFKLDGACKCLMNNPDATEDKSKNHKFSLWRNNLVYKNKKAKEVDAQGNFIGKTFPYDESLELLSKISCFLPLM